MSPEPVRPIQDPQAKQESCEETVEQKSQARKFSHKQEQPTEKTTNDVQHLQNPLQSLEGQQNGGQRIFVPVENTVTLFSYILWGLVGLGILAIIFLGYLKLTSLWKQHLSSANTLYKINKKPHETVQKTRICPRCGWKCPLEATECINPKCRTRF